MHDLSLDFDASERFIAEPKPAPDRRGSPRERVDLPGLLVDPAGGVCQCMIVDRSQGGFRIRLLDDNPIPEVFGLIDLVAGVGFEGHVVWRQAHLAGARALVRHDLRAGQKGFAQRLQDAWTAALT